MLRPFRRPRLPYPHPVGFSYINIRFQYGIRRIGDAVTGGEIFRDGEHLARCPVLDDTRGGTRSNPQPAQLLIRYGIGVETEQPEPAHSSRIGTTGRVFLLLGKRIAQQRGTVAEPGPERLRHEPHERTEQREQQQYRPALTGRELPAPPGTIPVGSHILYLYCLCLYCKHARSRLTNGTQPFGYPAAPTKSPPLRRAAAERRRQPGIHPRRTQP